MNLVLTFNEKIDVATANGKVADIKLFDADGSALTNLVSLTGETATELAATSKTLTFDLSQTPVDDNKREALEKAFNTGKTVKITLEPGVAKDEAGLLNVVTTYKDGGITVAYKDYVAPTGITLSVTNQNLVVVKFNEPVDKTAAETVANYTIKDSTGATLAIAKAVLQAVATDGSQEVYLTTATQVASAPYTMSVKDVKDVAGNIPAAALTNTFVGSAKEDTQKLTVDALVANAPINSKNDTLTVTFNTAPDTALATNVANYVVLEATADTTAAWNNAKQVSLTNAKAEMVAGQPTKVTITLDAPNLQNDKWYKVVVSNVTTVTGKPLGTATGDNDAVIQLTGVTAPLKANVTVTQCDTAIGAVKLIFDQELKGADAAANYKVGAATPTKVTYTWDAATKKATVLLDLANALTTPQNVTLVQDATITTQSAITNLAGVGYVVEGSGNVISAPSALTDLTKPQVATVTGTTTGNLDSDTITITFNELVRPADATTAANYTIALADGTSFPATALKKSGATTPDITYDGAGNVTIKLDNSGTSNDGKKYNLTNGTGKVSVTVANVRDLAGNVIDTVTKSGDVAGDTVKPDFNTATLTSPYTIDLAFTKAVDPSTVTKEDFKVTVKGSSPEVVIAISSIELSKVDYKTLTITSTTPLDAATQYTVAGSATASVKDLAGNEQTTFTAKDTSAVTVTAPNAAAVKALAGTNPADYINIASKANVTVTVGFAGNATGVVTVTLTDSDSKVVTKTAPISNTTSVDVTGIDSSTLKDGAITVKAKINTNGIDSTVFSGTDATKDTVAPTSTITGATYTAASDTIVLTGTGFENTFDATKITYKDDASNAYVVGTGGAATVTVNSAIQVTIVLSAADGTAIEALANYGGADDVLDVAADYITDAAGNKGGTANAAVPVTIN